MKSRSLAALSVVFAFAVSLSFAAAASPAARKTAARNAPSTAPAPEVPIFDSEAVGQKQIADYQKVSLDSGRRLLLVFGTNECATCRAFNRAIHEKVFFGAFINQFIPVFVDVSSGSNATLLSDYNINPAADQPGIVMLMPDARIVEVLAQGEMAALARKSDSAVRDFFLSRFMKSEK